MRMNVIEGCEQVRRMMPGSDFFTLRCYGGGSVPDPNAASVQGIQQQAENYPFAYLINSLSQTGGNATLPAPGTGTPTDYNFTGLGNQEVQNQVSGQMAQVLLDIQQGYGPQFIQQRLSDLKQSDPAGYAAYGQLFDQIQNDISQNPPDQPLSQATQSGILNVLQTSQNLTPDQLSQVQNAARGQNVASGVYLGNAPAQAEANAVVGATDVQNNQAQSDASKYLASGVTPSDISYRQIQQNMANLGAFINGQTPTAEFGSLSGAQGGAAPENNTGYTTPGLNEASGASQGLNQAQGLFEANQQVANPYLAGLNIATNGISTANNIYNSLNTNSYTTNNPIMPDITPVNQTFAPDYNDTTSATGTDWSNIAGGNTQ